MNQVYFFYRACKRCLLAFLFGMSAASLVVSAEIDEEIKRLYEQGKAFYQEGKFLEATEAFERALQLSRQQAPAPREAAPGQAIDQRHLEHLRQGQALYRQRRYDKAAERFEQALELKPTSEEAATWLIRARQALARQEVTEQLRAHQEAARREAAQRKQAEQLERETRKAQTRAARQAKAKREPAPQVTQEAQAIRARILEYPIGIGDVIEVFVWQQPDLTRDVIVRPDGRLSFPLVGDVEAVGLSLTELDEVLTERLKTYLRFPDVSVAIRRFGGTKTIVLGEVARPGVYVPAGQGRVLEVIAMAGGFTEESRKTSVVVIRGGLQQPQVMRLNLQNALWRGQLNQNVALQPDDIVYVPRRFIASTLEFMEQFYPTISETLVAQQIAENFGVREVSGGITR